MFSKFFIKYKGLSVTAKATLWFVACSILQQGISFITVPIFTRLLDQYQYGQYSAYLSWTQIFTTICTLRLDYAVFNKGMSKYPKDRDEYTSSMQGLTTIVTLLVLFIYLFFSTYINKMTELPTFIMVGLFLQILFYSAFNFWMLRRRYEYRYKDVVFATLILSVLNPTIGIIAVSLTENRGIARILSCILVHICLGLFFYYINLRKGKRLVNYKFWKFALLFNLPLIPHYFSSYIVEHSDRLMIQKMCGMSMVALYSVAYNIGSLMKIVTTSVSNATIPWLYDQMGKKKFQAIEKQLISMMFFISIIVIGLTMVAPELIFVIAGESYSQAVYVVPPVTASMYFVFIYGFLANIEFYYDANKFTMYITMSGAVLNVILNYIMIEIYGYIAAAYTSLFCYLITFLGHYIYVKLIVKTKEQQRIFNNKRFLGLSLIILCVTICTAFLYRFIYIRYAVICCLVVLAFVYRNRLISILKVKKK